jgi:hypothetical protein
LRSKPIGPQDYLHTFPDHNLTISLSGVALVKVDAGASFYSLKTTSSASRFKNIIVFPLQRIYKTFIFYFRLYIDLNQGRRGDEENLNIKGFKSKNIYFITKKERIQLEEVSLSRELTFVSPECKTLKLI